MIVTFLFHIATQANALIVPTKIVKTSKVNFEMLQFCVFFILQLRFWMVFFMVLLLLRLVDLNLFS